VQSIVTSWSYIECKLISKYALSYWVVFIAFRLGYCLIKVASLYLHTYFVNSVT